MQIRGSNSQDWGCPNEPAPRGTPAGTEPELYGPPDCARRVAALRGAEVAKAVGRRHGALGAVCDALSTKFPDRWRARAIDEHGEDFVGNRVLRQGLVSGMGADCLSATQWIACLKKNFQSIVDAFEEQHKGELTKFEAILGDSCDLSATILAYNKKLRLKIGKGYDMPQALSDRMLQHVNMK